MKPPDRRIELDNERNNRVGEVRPTAINFLALARTAATIRRSPIVADGEKLPFSFPISRATTHRDYILYPAIKVFPTRTRVPCVGSPTNTPVQVGIASVRLNCSVPPRNVERICGIDVLLPSEIKEKEKNEINIRNGSLLYSATHFTFSKIFSYHRFF